MPGPLNHITRNDILNANSIAGTALYTVLKNDVPDEKKKEMLSRIYALTEVLSMPDRAYILFGEKYRDFCNDGENQNLLSPSAIPGTEVMTGADFEVFSNPSAKKPLEDFANTMKELSEMLDNKIKNTPGLSQHEADFIYMMKGVCAGLGRGESLSEQYYKYPQLLYASNMFFKLYLTGAAVLADEDTKVVTVTPTLENNDDMKVISNLKETGIVQAMAGAVKVSEMQDRYTSKGDVSREELIEEYKQQAERVDKALSMSEETFNRLNPDNQPTFGNSYDEVTGGERGYLFVKEDAEIRSRLLDAGYPVEDINSLSQIYRSIKSMESVIEDSERTIKRVQDEILAEEQKENPNQQLLTEKRRSLEQWVKKRTCCTQALELISDKWDSVLSANDLTEEKRNDLLTDLKNATAQAVRDYHAYDKQALDAADWALGERLKTPLKSYEKALLSGSARNMYEMVNAVDPALVKSSDQFDDFKKKLKALKDYEAENEGELKDGYGQGEYRDLAKKVAQAAAKYLRYKTRQMEVEGKKHKRSDLEAERIRVVDSVLTALNNKKIPGTQEDMLAEEVEGIRRPFSQKRIPDPKGEEGEMMTVTSYPDTIKASERNYDYSKHNLENYIRLHTGKGAVNGTLEEMREDFAKVLAAIVWTKRNPFKEFNLEEAHKLIPEVKKLYHTDSIGEKDLTEALSSENSPERYRRHLEKYIYSVPNLFQMRNDNKATRYENYINHARVIYKFLPEPENRSQAYKELFETVQIMAHLDKHAPETLGKNLMDRTVSELNMKAYQKSLEILEKGKGNDLEGDSALHVLATLNHFATPYQKEHISGIFNNVNYVNFQDKPTDKDYRNIKNYGSEAIYKAVYVDKTHQNKRELNPDVFKKVYRNLAKNTEEVVLRRNEKRALGKMLRNKGFDLKISKKKTLPRPKAPSLDKLEPGKQAGPK